MRRRRPWPNRASLPTTCRQTAGELLSYVSTTARWTRRRRSNTGPNACSVHSAIRPHGATQRRDKGARYNSEPCDTPISGRRISTSCSASLASRDSGWSLSAIRSADLSATERELVVSLLRRMTRWTGLRSPPQPAELQTWIRAAPRRRSLRKPQHLSPQSSRERR